MESVNILIAIQYQIVRDGIRKILEDEAGITITRTLRSVDEFSSEVFCGQDILIVDLDMPGIKTPEIFRQIRDSHPSMRLIGISKSESGAKIKNFMEAGASGYLFKKRSAGDLIEAVRKVSNGEKYLCDEAIRLLVNLENANSADAGDITDREMEVLILICRELTNREIANQLGISVRTVDAHRRNILQKTGAKNTAGLVKYAIKHQIFTP